MQPCIKVGVPNMAEVGYCPIFVAENGNVLHISADSDTKIVNETERVGKGKVSI